MSHQQIDTCPFCNTKLSLPINNYYGGFFDYKCPICTNVRYDDFGDGLILDGLTEIERIKLRWYFKTRTDKVKILGKTISLDEVLDLVSYPARLLDKINLVLYFIDKKTDYFYQEIIIYYETDYPQFFCRNHQELKEIIYYLHEAGYIQADNRNNFIATVLTPAGMKYLENLDKNPQSNQCFVAMWFNKDELKGPNMEKIYSGCIEPVVNDECGYVAIKINNKEHINYITDEIIKEIKRSKFLIADLTGSRGGVYYEAGFAFGLGIPVIFTCNKDWEENIIKECGCIRDGIHFDIKQRNIIFWQDDKLDEFKKALTNRIGAVIGLNK